MRYEELTNLKMAPRDGIKVCFGMRGRRTLLFAGVAPRISRGSSSPSKDRLQVSRR